MTNRNLKLYYLFWSFILLGSIVGSGAFETYEPRYYAMLAISVLGLTGWIITKRRYGKPKVKFEWNNHKTWAEMWKDL